MIAYVSAGSTVVEKKEKKHIPTVIKSLLLSGETVGGTGLKSHREIYFPSMKWIFLMLLIITLCAQDLHSRMNTLNNVLASVHTIHTLLLGNSFSRAAFMNLGCMLAKHRPKFDILSTSALMEEVK